MKIFIAIPAYTGKVDVECCRSLMMACRHLIKSGIDYDICEVTQDCYIANARNKLVNMFLFKTDCDAMVFVDADLEFDEDAITKVALANAPIVGGAYPAKYRDVYTAGIYLKNDKPLIDEDTGLIKAQHVPTGMMKISRKAFDTFIRCKAVRVDKDGMHWFFNTGFEPYNDGNWYGEDVWFCKRWRDLGGDILCDPTIRFGHIGVMKKSGTYLEHLKEVINYDSFGVDSKRDQAA